MRRGLGLLGLVLTLVIIGIVGVIAYNVGWSDGLAQHLPEGSSTAAPAVYPYPYYGYGPHFFGFGWIFGLLFFLFFLFVIFRIARFAMFGGRGWGRYGPGGPGGWHQYREERMREWHERVHSVQAGSQTPPPPPPPPTTTA